MHEWVIKLWVNLWLQLTVPNKEKKITFHKFNVFLIARTRLAGTISSNHLW